MSKDSQHWNQHIAIHSTTFFADTQDKKRYNYQDGGLLGDLDKDGELSGYEKARQDAIEKNMRTSLLKIGLNL